MKKILVVLVPSLVLLACGVSESSVARARAANDLACPASSIEVRQLSMGTVEATGCGQRAIYTCPRHNAYSVACIREAAAVP